MKISVVLLLVAVSTCYGFVQKSSKGGYGQYPPGHGGIPPTQCLHVVLKTDLPALLTAVQALICSYQGCMARQGKKDHCSIDEWEVLCEKVTTTLKNTGCAVDQLLSLKGKPVEKLAEGIGKALEELHKPIRCLLIKLPVLDGFNAEELVFSALCPLLSKILPHLSELLAKLGDIADVSNLVEVLAGVTGGVLGGGIGGGLLDGVTGGVLGGGIGGGLLGGVTGGVLGVVTGGGLVGGVLGGGLPVLGK